MLTEARAIARQGENCWRIRRADRVAFLIDGADYFAALDQALEQARQSIFILCWDIDSRLRLRPAPTPPRQSPSPPLRTRLDALVRRRPDLHVQILNWDYSWLVGGDREWLARFKFDWITHERLCFRMDDHYPMGACHHEKVVVIDDVIAFVGGIDPTRERWDTPAHRANDPRRSSADGCGGRPHHDIQVAVAGPVASSLGELARQRWRLAGGAPPPLARSPRPIWPQGLKADMQQVDVAIARTRPAYGRQREVREVERSILDAIAAARDLIYIENQYFTSQPICDALAERLASPSAPEVILVLPKETDGWLSQNTLDLMRIRLIDRLSAADRHGRLAIYYPHIPGRGNDCLRVHSKCMIIDDRLVRIGSANLCNRSMSLDTECDLWLQADPEEPHQQRALRGLRHRLLAEHLDIPPAAVAANEIQAASTIGMIEQCRGGARSLRALREVLPRYRQDTLSAAQIVDPEQPLTGAALLGFMAPEGLADGSRRRWWPAVALAALVLGAALAWRTTALADYLSVDQLSVVAQNLREARMGPLWLLAAFVAASLVMVPVTALIAATLLVYGPGEGFVYALAGSLAAAIAGYGVGQALKRTNRLPFRGRQVGRVARWLGEHGLAAVVTVRLVPVSPFSVVNMVAGASAIRLRDFVLGTLLGLAPGIAALAFFADRLQSLWRNPTLESVASLLLGGAAIVLALYGLRRWARRRADD